MKTIDTNLIQHQAPRGYAMLAQQRNMDGETEAEKAAREAAEKEAADKAAKDKADKEAAEKAEADKNKTSGMTDKEAELLKEVMATKKKAKEQEDALAAATAKLAAFDGLDATELKKLVEEKATAAAAAKKAEEDRLAAAGDFDRLKAMMKEEHEKVVGGLTEKVTSATDALAAATRQIEELTIGRDFATSKFVADELILPPTKARAVYQSYCEVKDGRTVVYDKPAGAAKRTLIVGADGEPLAFDAAMKKVIDADPEKDLLLRSKMLAGPGARVTSVTKVDDKNRKTTEQPEIFGQSRMARALAAGALKKPEKK